MSKKPTAPTASAELLEKIVNRSADSISVVDRDLRYVFVNRALESVTGIAAEKWMGHTSEEIGFPKETCEQWARTFKQVLETGRPARAEYSYQSKIGLMTVQSMASPIRGEGGVIEKIVTVSRDISDLRQAEEKTRESRERLGLSLSASQLGMWDWDFVTGEIHTDARYAEIIGEDPATFRNNIHTVEERLHPDDKATTLATVAEHIKGHTPFYKIEARFRARDGSWKWVATYGQVVQRDAQGRALRITGTNQDIDVLKRSEQERHQLTEQLARQAVEDPLTGLMNRRGFEQRLQALLDEAQTGGSEHALCYLDLDQFKLVNDSCGHAAGDELLRQLEPVLRPTIRPQDVLARLGGDEFGVLLHRCTLEEARVIAEQIRDAVHRFRFVRDRKTFALGVSIGVVPITADSDTMNALLSAADGACYVAKEAGRNRVHVSLPNDEQVRQHRRQLQWAGRIREALEQNRFQLRVEPIRPLSPNGHGRLRGEVLVRMLDAHGIEVSPGLFIPTAERYQMMMSVDLWVLRHLLQYLAGPGAGVIRDSKAMIAVNLSGNSLGSPRLYDDIAALLSESGVPPDRLCFEVTETAAIANLAESSRLMKKLKDAGCQFSLDDFGTGMSSFGYLKNLPVDYLKIDGSFIKTLATDPLSRDIVAAVNQIGHRLGLLTIAEHVETPALLDTVRALGMDFAQGYALSQPRPLDELAAVLK